MICETCQDTGWIEAYDPIADSWYLTRCPHTIVVPDCDELAP